MKLQDVVAGGIMHVGMSCAGTCITSVAARVLRLCRVAWCGSAGLLGARVAEGRR